jgi:hypothetical protein
MLQYQPEDRLTLDEIKSHPWFTGQSLSADEVNEELNKRKQMLEGYTGDDGDCPEQVDANVFTDSSRVHRGEDDGEEDTTPSLERTCKEYVPSPKLTKFFST